MLKYAVNRAREERAIGKCAELYQRAPGVRERGVVVRRLLRLEMTLSDIAQQLARPMLDVQREYTAAGIDKPMYEFLEAKLLHVELMSLLDLPAHSIHTAAGDAGYLPPKAEPSRRGRPQRHAARFDDMALVEAIRVVLAQFDCTSEEVARRLNVPAYLIYRLRPLLGLSTVVLAEARRRTTPRQLMLHLVDRPESEALAMIQAYADGKTLASLLAEMTNVDQLAALPFGVQAADMSGEFTEALTREADRLHERITGDEDLYPATTMAIAVTRLLAERLTTLIDAQAEEDPDDLEDLLMAEYRRIKGA